MWDGVTYVDPVRNPIISEGSTPARLVILNAGPFSVAVQCWQTTTPDIGRNADIDLQLWPGNTCSVAANLIRVMLMENLPHHTRPRGQGPAPFAAIAWRVLS